MATKLSKDVIEKILAGIKTGLPKESAANISGITKETLMEWQRKGRADLTAGRKSLHSYLMEQMPAAEAECEAHYLDKVNGGGRGWQAAAWYLERSRPYKYGRRYIVETPKVDPDAADKLVVLE